MRARRFRSAVDLLRSWQQQLAAASWKTRVATILGGGAVALAFLTAICGINGPIPEGHTGASAACGTAAFNMWHWRIWYPISSYVDRPPPASMAYMHHPMGIFWTLAIVGKLFGFANWILRIAPLVYVTATTALLWRIGRALWGQIPGALTAVAFVAMPITLGFANYHDLEQPVIFGCVLATWGYVCLLRSWRLRHALAGAVGFAFALGHDWPAYMWGAAFLPMLFVYGYVVPERLRAPIDARAFGRFWAMLALAVAANLIVEIFALWKTGRMNDVLASYNNRSLGSDTPLATVLAARHYRINLMFTALVIVMGKLALPVIVARGIARRDHREWLALPLFVAAVVQYTQFKQGADVHIFWPHYFTPYFALAAGALAATVADVTTWAGAWLRRGAAAAAWARAAPWAALVAIGLPLAVVVKDGLSLVRLARETGGRFAEANLDSDYDRHAVLSWFLPKVPANLGIAYHPGIYASWAVQWTTRPRTSTNQQTPASPVTPSTRIYIMDTRKASAADLRLAAARYHVHAVEHLWVFDRGAPVAPLEGYALDEREPTLREWWSQGPTETIRSVRPSAWVTWEWRTLLGQPATAPPSIPVPVTTEELRIAHNVAVEDGNADAAARLRGALAVGFNLPLAARFDGDTTLIGALRRTGARRSVTLFFTAGTMTGDNKFLVHAKVVAPPRLSTLPVDPAELELAGSPMWPTNLWRRGHIYSLEAVYRKRPGTEVLSGAWSPGPKRVDGPTPLEIVRL
jgi:hypothetical protein